MINWKSLHIKRFRRLEDLRLDDLGAVNILVGKNNSGKTTVLEALAVACHPLDAFTWIDLGREREVKSARTPTLEILNWFFPRTQPRTNEFEGKAEISGVTEEAHDLVNIEAGYREFRWVHMPIPGSPSMVSNSPSLEMQEDYPEYAAELKVKILRTNENSNLNEPDSRRYMFSIRGDWLAPRSHPFFPSCLVTTVSHRTSRQLLETLDRVLEERRKPEVLRLLQKLAPDVDDIEIRSPEGRGAVIHLHHSTLGHVPLAVEGDGMRRALALASAAAMAKGGVLLIDEVETALHPDALTVIFRFLVDACREMDIQLFVTTHSLEAVDAMLASMGDDIENLVAYRLPPRGGEVPVKRFSGPTIRDLRHDGGLDLR